MKRALPLYASPKHAGKKLLFILFLSAGTINPALAQTRISDNPAIPRDPSAMLEVSSTATPFRGFLMPRLTSAQRNAMSSPAVGLMIFNTTTNQVEVNTGTTLAPLWTPPVTPTPGSWFLAGNAGINPATQFLGTTDVQPLIFRSNNAERMRILANGNIGIGTGAPQNLLDLGMGRGATTADVAGKKLSLYNFTDGSDFYGFGVSSGILQFHAASNPTEEPGMVLNSTGSVGIGTVAPAATLDVAGTVRISGSAGTATALAGRNATGDISNLALGSGLSITGGTLNTTAAAGWSLTGNAGTAPATNFIGTTDVQPLVFRTNNAEQMRLDATGNLSLGTSSSSAKMSIVSASGNGLTVTAPAVAGTAIPMIVQTTAGSSNSGVALRINSLQTNGIGNLDMGVLTGQMGSLQFYRQPGNIPGPIVLNAISGGNVGIGTGAPNSLLDLGTSRGGTTSDVNGKKLAVYNFPDGNDFYGLGVSTGILQFHASSSPAEEPGMILNSTGSVGIGTVAPTATLSVNGAANNTTGVWGIFSDARIKTVDEDFTDGLSTVMQIRPIKFRYNADAPFRSDDEQIGIVAQEMEAIAPYMITKVKAGNYNDLRQYNAQALPYLLVNAVHELKNELDAVKKENAELKAKVAGITNVTSPTTGTTVAELLERIKKMEEALGVAGK